MSISSSLNYQKILMSLLIIKRPLIKKKRKKKKTNLGVVQPHLTLGSGGLFFFCLFIGVFFVFCFKLKYFFNLFVGLNL
jgi:hypothetical protein